MTNKKMNKQMFSTDDYRRLQIYVRMIVHNYCNENDIDAYKGQNILLRHIDNDTSNNHFRNLEYVGFNDVIENIDNWTVDWVCFLPEPTHNGFRDLCRKYKWSSS